MTIETHDTGSGQFDAGKLIIGHVSNSPHPIIELPTVFGINLSVTKHVLMLWIVAVFLFTVITWSVRKYLKQEGAAPTGFMNALEGIVEFIRDSVVLPNVGPKFVTTWTPLVLTFFFFILTANAMGLVPLFEILGLIDRLVLKTGEHSIINRVIHGGTTATGNYNVTAALATVTFFAIITAGVLAHGFIKHWKNMVPHGMAWPVYILLIPIETLSMFVKPFALTMRLAANMTGGHIAILAVTSLVFIFSGLFHTSWAGAGALLISIPLSVGISALEIIVVMVQAYVFTMLSAVFIGMAINVHH
jgi:F-type H+-transporting ATPase subunit a